jgi:signal transduction histidine kinase
VGVQWRARERAEEAARQLAEAREQLVAARQAREALTRDLHDGAVQTLYGMGIGLLRARRLMGRDAKAAEALVGEQSAAVEALMELLRAHVRGEQVRVDLPRAVRELAEALERAVGVRVEARLEAEALGRLTEAEAEHLAAMARETASNAWRHGGATGITLALEAAGAGWVFTARDDGRGFDAASAEARGTGLTSLATRSAEMGAVLKVESSPGGGTVVTVRREGGGA